MDDWPVEFARLEARFEASEKALVVQRDEYARRLHELNGEYKRDRERQQDYVSIDKYEDKVESIERARQTAEKAEKEAREQALIRVDEKFNEYIKKWEQVQQEQANQIVTLTAAAAEAKRIAEDQGRLTRDEADRRDREQKMAIEIAQRRQARNITIVGIALAAVVGLANILPGLLG